MTGFLLTFTPQASTHIYKQYPNQAWKLTARILFSGCSRNWNLLLHQPLRQYPPSASTPTTFTSTIPSVFCTMTDPTAVDWANWRNWPWRPCFMVVTAIWVTTAVLSIVPVVLLLLLPSPAIGIPPTCSGINQVCGDSSISLQPTPILDNMLVSTGR